MKTKEELDLPDVLKENEYLLKVRKDKTGFLTKYNKNGTIPVAFVEWGTYGYLKSLTTTPIQIHTEEFKKGWKFVSYRIGKSQSWATVRHPNGFYLEIYLSNLMDICANNTLVKGEIMGKFKWDTKKIVSVVTDLKLNRNHKLNALENEMLFNELNENILRTESEELIDLWKDYQKIKK